MSVGAERVGSNIEIIGVGRTIRALATFEPEMHKALNAEIRESLNQVREGAKGRYPKGSWSVRLNKKKILGQIMASSGGTRAPRWADSAPGIRAAIFEFAGSVQRGRTPQARRMIESLNMRYGMPGRFLWDAWDETGANVLQDVKAAVKIAERELQKRVDGAGGVL